MCVIVGTVSSGLGGPVLRKHVNNDRFGEEEWKKLLCGEWFAVGRGAYCCGASCGASCSRSCGRSYDASCIVGVVVRAVVGGLVRAGSLLCSPPGGCGFVSNFP